MSVPQNAKIRLGLYIYTPMIGGAELYFKDLLWNIDRTQFDVTVFCEQWNEFIDFLDLPHCPSATVCTLTMREIGGHYGAKELTDATAPKQLRWWERRLLGIIAIQKGIQSPILKIPGRLVRALMHIVFLFSNIRMLSRAFQTNPVDVLHVINGGYPGAQTAQLAAWMAKRNKKCRGAVMSICNTPVAYHFPKSLEWFLDRQVQRYYDFLIVPGESIKQLLIRLRGFCENQIKKIPEGVATADAYGATLVAREMRQKNSSSPVIVVVAGFLERKGHRFLLDAIATLLPNYPGLRATLIGDGPLLAEMKHRCTELGISNAVEFLGFRPLAEMLEILHSADLLVHPALMEGMPYVILHAMSLGVPVVATPIGDIPETVLDGVTGVLVPPGDADAIAKALAELFSHPDRMATMGVEGYRRYSQEYSRSVMVSRHETLYRALAEPNDH